MIERCEPLTNIFDCIHHFWEHPRTQKILAVLILLTYLLALAGIEARTLVVGITTDINFTPAEMRRLHAMIPGSTYHEIDSPFGHDGFLVEYEQLNEILLPFMQGESFHVTQ